MTARDHNRLLGIFYFIQAGLQLIVGAFVFIIYVVLGGAMISTSTRDSDQMMGGVFFVMGVVVGLICLAFGGFTLLAGFSVFKEKPVGRILGIVVSLLVLLSFPIGTALGIYGLWFFFGEVGKNYYAGISGAPSTAPPPPPAPNSWQ